MARPIVPPAMDAWINSTASRQTTQQFPYNLCAILSPEVQQDILLFINQNYVWPQIQERMPFESAWDHILDMYRIKHRVSDTRVEEQSPAGRDLSKSKKDEIAVADSLIHDAIERLVDVSHFVSFKEDLPVQFIIPPYYDNRLADQFYDPMRDRITTVNALLSWNFDQEEIYRKHIIALRGFYTYGIQFVQSEFAFEAEATMKMQNNGQQIVTSQFKRIGTTFDPISIRSIWLNWRLGAYDMDFQPCPFLCKIVPRWSVLQNKYEPDNNPFGYYNLDLIPTARGGSWMSSPSGASMRKAVESLVGGDRSINGGGYAGLADILRPEHSVEQLWDLYPMLPLDPDSGDWKTYAKDGPGYKAGDAVPYVRFIANIFGEDHVGNQTLLRLQRNFYPRDQVPLYASCHMPDLDSGLYTPAIGNLLWNHYAEICTSMVQYITNKDLANNPPSMVMVGSPAKNQSINKPGEKILVNSPADVTWRQTFDATQTTVGMIEMLRNSAKQTAKSTDALMGQAMGSRTSATEASNAFQASMSAVTTPINMFNHDLMGGYARRLWDYTASWFPPELLRILTGQMGFVLNPQDLWLQAGIKTDSGSTYIESIVRQQNLQYILSAGAMDPSLKRTEFWKMLLREFKFANAEELVDDGGFDKEVQRATLQATETFLGKPVMVSPDQDHGIAIRVKTSFLEDQESWWMTQHRDMAILLVNQINQHQQFQMLQFQQQLAMAQAGMPVPAGDHSLIHSGGNPPAAPQLIQQSGQASQQGGGTV